MLVGAMPSGDRTGVPSRDVPVSTRLTSRSTCGRNRNRSQAAVASAVVTPSRAPCRRYRITGSGSTSHARASRSSANLCTLRILPSPSVPDMTLLRQALVGLVLLIVLGCASSGSPHNAGPGTRRAVLHTGQGPVGLAAGGTGRLWVANADGGTVELIEASSGTVVRRARVVDAPLRLARVPGAVW